MEIRGARVNGCTLFCRSINREPCSTHCADAYGQVLSLCRTPMFVLAFCVLIVFVSVCIHLLHLPATPSSHPPHAILCSCFVASREAPGFGRRSKACCGRPMSPRKESAEEKAARLLAKGHELRVKADYVKICQVLRNREDLIHRVKRSLVDWGELSADGEVVDEDTRRVLKKAKEEQATGKEVPKEATIGDDASAGGALDLHRNFNHWHQLSPGHLATILGVCEPSSMSLGNMKPIIKKGCKFPPKAALLELLEFLVDRDPNSELPSRSMQLVIEAAVDANSSGGRRGRDLVFPVCWPSDGLYELVALPPCVKLRYRYTGDEVVIPKIKVIRCATYH